MSTYQPYTREQWQHLIDSACQAGRHKHIWSPAPEKLTQLSGVVLEAMGFLPADPPPGNPALAVVFQHQAEYHFCLVYSYSDGHYWWTNGPYMVAIEFQHQVENLYFQLTDKLLPHADTTP